MIRLLSTCVLLVVLCATASAQGFLPTSGYQRQKASGFTLYVHPDVEAQGKSGRDGVALVKRKLAEVAKRLPKQALEHVRKVPVFVEWQSASSTCIDYLRDATGLTHVELNLDKLKAVEIGSLPCFVERVKGDEPMLLMRELAFAYQDRVVGWEVAEVAAAWTAAKGSGKYDLVPHVAGGMREPTALASPQSFFAEVTESLYGRNDFFPFDRPDLVRYDKEACAVVAKAWAAPAKVCVEQPPPKKEEAPRKRMRPLRRQ